MAKKKRICIDLDGVLAQYDGWRGVDHIGDPIPNAQLFLKILSKDFKIIIFTARCHKMHDQENLELSKQIVKEWLDLHGFIYDDIYVGQGKPPAKAYVDDRGVSCRPQDNMEATGAVYKRALDQIRKL